MTLQPPTFNDILDFAIALPIAIIIMLFVVVICLTIDEKEIRSHQ